MKRIDATGPPEQLPGEPLPEKNGVALIGEGRRDTSASATAPINR
jgi:hypothetical protein